MKSFDLKSLKTLLAISLCLLLPGCAGVVGSFDAPRVTLADIRVEQIKTLETAFLVQLRVTNPNEKPLEIRGLSCEVELEGKPFASGIQGEQQSIPPYSSTLVPVQVYASMLDMVSSVIGLLQESQTPQSAPDSLQYMLSGTVDIRSGALSKKLPFESSGELRLK